MAETTPAHVAAVLLPEATRRLIRATDALADGDYVEPSALPGWSRGHVVAHLALNADALAGTLRGVVEGRRVPMYPSQDQRNADVDHLAGQSPTVLRARLMGACTDLADALVAVPGDEAGATIERVPGGPTFTVASVPLMRVREVEIHHVDLAVGYTTADWSAEFAMLLIETMPSRADRSGAFRAEATDLGRTWAFGDGSGPTVSGSAADLGWWLTGRGAGEGLTSEGGDLPQIGAW